MSEYQYYEFVAIDRPLDDQQMAEIRALSTRASITPTSFVNTYEWGDFRGDPNVLMERYYDAFLYLANWGTRRVTFRLPLRLLDLPTAHRYCVGDAASVRASGDHLVIDLISDEADDFVDTGDGWLSSIVPARAGLVAGDRRLLYLVWLLCVQNREVADEEVEPPVPPGLGSLTASLTSVADFLRIDPDLIAAAQQGKTPEVTPAEDMAAWVASMPAAEKDDVLLTLLRGDDPHLRAGLLQRFRGVASAPDGCRTVGSLQVAAEERWAERARAAEEKRLEAAAARKRREEEARERRLAAVAAEGDRAWSRVDEMIATKKPAEYDRAVALLADLSEVAAPIEFDRRITDLRKRHTRKPSLLDRLDRAGLLRDCGRKLVLPELRCPTPAIRRRSSASRPSPAHHPRRSWNDPGPWGKLLQPRTAGRRPG
jgi:hypothetical protein